MRPAPDPEQDRSTRRAPSLRHWPRFTDDEVTPVLGLRHRVKLPDISPPPLPRAALPPPPVLAAETTARIQIVEAPPKSGPPSLSSVTTATPPLEARPSNIGWYLSGILGVMLVLTLVRDPAPDLPTSAAAGAPAADVTALAEPAPAGAASADPPPAQAEPTPAPGPAQPEATPVQAAARPAPKAAEPTPAVTFETETRAASAAQRRGALSEAAAGYTRALALNPQYFPASLGLADSQYELGNRTAARLEYRRMLATFPTSMPPERARLRAAEDR